jgi:aspartate carbamoyltransferase catalytic subunit
MQFLEFESRIQRPERVKETEFLSDGRLKHLIFVSQLTPALIERLCNTADRIRLLARSREGSLFLQNLLPHKSCMLFFTQPSTRTINSFLMACQHLGMKVGTIEDPKLSSEVKGEHSLDSIQTLGNYYNMIIMRSPIPQLAECAAYLMNDLSSQNRTNLPVLSAGAGADEHPTQALLDVYTIQRLFEFHHKDDSSTWNYFHELQKSYRGLTKGIHGKTVGFCGDICRGRTVRSLAMVLSQYRDMNLYFFSANHPKLELPMDLRRRLEDRGARVTIFRSLQDDDGGKPAIANLDVLYMTRIQTEHNTDEDSSELTKIDMSKYKLTPQLVDSMKTYAGILHPLPRDHAFGEVPRTIDRNQRSYYFRQVRNGMWIRAALIAHVMNAEQEITEKFILYTKEHHNYNLEALR